MQMANDDHMGIDDKAESSLSVVPGKPKDEDRDLDEALDDSMDASDVPSSVQPGGDQKDPVPSSGYSEEAERQQDA
jgi:hypothetical protein